MELGRYRAQEEERQKWETRESRLFTRLEVVEEELRAVKEATADAEDNGRVSEQLRILTSELSAAQLLVSSLREENSHLVQENDRLGQENLMVQTQRPGLAREPGGAMFRNGRGVWNPHSSDQY